MSTPNDPNQPASDSTAPNVAVPAEATSVPAPKANLSLKPIAPAAPVTPPAQPASPTEAAAAAAPVASPEAAKPKLNLNLAPRSTATNVNKPGVAAASVQKIPERKYAPAVVQEDDQPSGVVTLIAGIAAAAAITFAVLLFLKTK